MSRLFDEIALDGQPESCWGDRLDGSSLECVDGTTPNSWGQPVARPTKSVHRVGLCQRHVSEILPPEAMVA